MKHFETIDTKTLHELMKQYDKKLFIFFGAQWKTSLHLISHSLEKLAQDYSASFNFVELDVDQDPLVVEQFNIQKIPTYIIFQEGEITDYFSGILSRKKIENKLRDNLQMP